jgi:peptidoglycan lytic transglycosylase G
MSCRDMHDYLLSGNQVLKRVTIPEGLTISKVASRLQTTGITSADAFLAAATDPLLMAEYDLPGESAEGFLFPDTYLFAEDFPADGVVRHMLERFFEVLEEIYPDYRSLSLEDIHDRVVVASIVEREYRAPEEAPKIASVFYNRLDVNMRLESCATVVYVITEQEGLPHPQRLFYRDLERPNPYNTYYSFGLPPGPIANPGRTALDAAFFPESTDYRFFVWNGPGSESHAFTRTLSEHNEARLLYLKSP